MTLDLLPLLDADTCPQPDPDAGLGTLRTEKGALPLVALDVQARLDGLVAAVELTQTFHNAHDEPLEATYIFPLPDRAAVTAFRLEVAGRVVEGELQERGRARRTYDAAIRAGHRAAIAEEERAGVFTMRVGNLPPGERAVVRLALAGPVPYSDGEATFRFPLVVAPRYIPGSALSGPSAGSGVAADTDSVPDASRISPPVLLPGFPNPVRLSIAVSVPDSDLKPNSFRCSLHSVIEQQGEGVHRCRLTPGERLDRDFVLRWRLGGEGVGTSLAVKPEASGEEGTFLLTVTPPAHLGEGCRPRDVVFVLDRSGSMSGWKMVAARRAVARMVETLTEHDRFTVYAFDDSVETPPGFDGVALVPASDRQRFRAAEFLAGIDARGGTEMAEPLVKAVAELNRGGAAEGVDRVLVLITDGQVGNEDEILKGIAPGVANLRVFTLGIDRAVNAAFLRRLADLGRGASEVVESEQRLDEVMDQVHRNIGTAVLTDLSLSPAGLGIVSETLVPARLPDLFAGAPVVITGRYRGSPHGAVVLRGVDAQGQKWAGEVTAAVRDGAPLDKVWGRGRVRELEDRYAVQPAGRAQLEREIVATSLSCGVLSRFTAYVAVDRAEKVNPGGDAKRVTQAVEQPAGWGQVEAMAAQAAPPAPGGVYRSRSLRGFALGGRVAPASGITPEQAEEIRERLAQQGAMPASQDGVTAAGPLAEAVEDVYFGLSKAPAGAAHPARDRAESPTFSEHKPESGLWQKVKAFFGVGEAKQKKGAPDLAALRARAEVILRRLEGASETAARRAALRAMQEEMADLVRDLLRAGDTSDALLALSKQVSGLGQLDNSPDDVVNRYHEGIVLALREWLTPAGAASGGREFWK